MVIPFDDIESAFQRGDAETIMSMSKTKTLISIENNEAAYSKSQGTLVLNEFFENHPPKSFEFDFKGKESGATSFAVGTYVSDEVFRVSLKLKKMAKDFAIESITISKN
jgi:hypothetical protein